MATRALTVRESMSPDIWVGSVITLTESIWQRVPSQLLSPGLGEHGPWNSWSPRPTCQKSDCPETVGLWQSWRCGEILEAVCVRESVRDGGRKGGGEREERHTHRGTLRRHLGQEPPASLPHVVWVRETLPSFGVICAQQRRARATFRRKVKQFSHGLFLFVYLAGLGLRGCAQASL